VENTGGKDQRDCVVEEAGLLASSASEGFYSEEKRQGEAPRHTLRVCDGREPGSKRLRIGEGLELTVEETQRARVEGATQLFEKQTAKEPREHPHRQEEARAAGDPVFAVRGQPAASYDAMHVRMMQQILPPRVQDRYEADLGAQMFGVGGDRAQRLGAGAKQQIVELLRSGRPVRRSAREA
jgi:hypothetical protein